MKESFPQPGTGCAGFGCGFLLAILLIWYVAVPEAPLELAIGLLAALLVGAAAARLGDPFFEKLLGLLRWFR